jgi:hypothetical protein
VPDAPPPTADGPAAASPPKATPPAIPRIALGPFAEDVHFEFHHRLFNVPGIWFGRTADLKDAGLYIPMGDFTACLTLDSVRESFRIEPGSHDDIQLDQVREALDYVKRITPGERIPREVVDGTASWSVEDPHRAIARAKLAIRLSRAYGLPCERPARLDDMVAFGTDGRAAAAITAALDRHMETHLGGEIDGAARTEVRNVAEAIVHESAYIEALREKMMFLPRIYERIGGSRQRFQSDVSLSEEIVMMHSLCRRPKEAQAELMATVDRILEDPVACLRAWPAASEQVRNGRNAMHRLAVDWSDLEPKWRSPPINETALANLLRETYRFLAMRYSRDDVWPRPT